MSSACEFYAAALGDAIRTLLRHGKRRCADPTLVCAAVRHMCADCDNSSYVRSIIAAANHHCTVFEGTNAQK